MNEAMEALQASLERLGARLEAAASVLEGSAARLVETGEVGKITASIDSSVRETELERRLAEAERELSALRASVAPEMPAGEVPMTAGGRKTLPAATVQLLAKTGLDAGETVDVGSLDAALAGLSVEQRIAVKSQMLRVGTLVL